MKNRIRELYKQAYGHFPSRIEKPEAEKFVELIVQDCLRVLRRRYTEDPTGLRMWVSITELEVKHCIEDVKKHFGVKE